MTSRGLLTERPPAEGWGWRAAPPVVAFAIALVTMSLGWQGVDWPAQLYRVQLFHSNGWIGFDTGWYGGNSPVAYSTLFPPIAATLGVHIIVLSCVALAAITFDRIVRRRFGSQARLGSLCFAAGLVVQVAIGQLPFLLGLTFGLGALLALLTGRTFVALILGTCCALASFVAALFLVLAAGAWWATSPPGSRRTRALLAASAAAPVALVAFEYHQVGQFPYPATTLAAVLAVCLGALIVIPSIERTLRLGVVVYAGLATALFVVRTPVGANVARLATTMAVPVLVLAGRRRFVVIALVLFVSAWELAPAVGAIGVEQRDPSTSRAFYAPLLAELARLSRSPARLEIPMTHEHWEAAWVAPKVPLARGWERQLDIGHNQLFYRSAPLTSGEYRSWLQTNGIRWVALPNAPLDYSAQSENRLLQSGAPYLKLVWQQHDWKLWQVLGSDGLIRGAAQLTDLDADAFTIHVHAPGDVLVRVHSSPTWTIVDADGASCLGSSADSWTIVRARRPGPIHVVAQMLPTEANRC